MDERNGDWLENRKYVLSGLSNLSHQIETLNHSVREVSLQLNTVVTTMRTRAILWGTMAGLTISAIGLLLQWRR